MPTVPTGIRSFPVLSTSLRRAEGGKRGGGRDRRRVHRQRRGPAADHRLVQDPQGRHRQDGRARGCAQHEPLGRDLSDELGQADRSTGTGHAAEPQRVARATDRPGRPRIGSRNFRPLPGGVRVAHRRTFRSGRNGRAWAWSGRRPTGTWPRHCGRGMLPIRLSPSTGARTAADSAQPSRIAAPPTTGTDSGIQHGCRPPRRIPAGDRIAACRLSGAGVEIVRDPYTGAAKGEIVVTGCVLVGGVVLLRSGAFVQDSFRVA